MSAAERCLCRGRCVCATRGTGHSLDENYGDGANWVCTCGVELWPDCDMSAASVCDEFERHLGDVLDAMEADAARDDERKKER